MIRAVSRYTLEINRTGSPYFERAICFVKPEYAQSDRIDLHRAAQQLIADFDSGVEERECREVLSEERDEASSAGAVVLRRLTKLLPMVLSAVIGAGATLLIMLLI